MNAVASLETLDSAIATIDSAFQQADGDGRDELENILEQQFQEQRSTASTALIQARRRDESNAQGNDPASTEQGSGISSGQTYSNVVAEPSKPALQIQPSTPHISLGR